MMPFSLFDHAEVSVVKLTFLELMNSLSCSVIFVQLCLLQLVEKIFYNIWIVIAKQFDLVWRVEERLVTKLLRKHIFRYSLVDDFDVWIYIICTTNFSNFINDWLDFFHVWVIGLRVIFFLCEVLSTLFGSFFASFRVAFYLKIVSNWRWIDTIYLLS